MVITHSAILLTCTYVAIKLTNLEPVDGNVLLEAKVVAPSDKQRQPKI